MQSRSAVTVGGNILSVSVNVTTVEHYTCYLELQCVAVTAGKGISFYCPLLNHSAIRSYVIEKQPYHFHLFKNVVGLFISGLKRSIRVFHIDKEVEVAICEWL